MATRLETEGKRLQKEIFRKLEAVQRGLQKIGDIYSYNGVWISGYFGSGKSHLLKILAYLMSSDADPQLRTIFLDKIEDSWLRTAIETAFRTPAASVLFNIDQQVDTQEASLLLDRYEANSSLTAEKLAKRIREWLDRQPVPAQLINFFVDEVGQFVSNWRDRMLNVIEAFAEKGVLLNFDNLNRERYPIKK